MAAPGVGIIQKAAEEGEFITLEDGFFYYWPNRPGAFSAHHLRQLADALDKMNADWQKQIETDMNLDLS
jgi:hypothetical protein